MVSRMMAMLLGLMAGLATVPVHAGAFDLPQLMGWLAQTRSGTATFVEERHVKGFDGPLSSEGELSFAAPDRFERRTLQPLRETLSVDGNVLTMSRGGRSRTLSLDTAPEAAAIVEAVRGTLTGNEAVLQKHFRVRLSGQPQAWVLDLAPRAAELARQVSDVQIRGERGLVRAIDVWLVGGDRSEMRVSPRAGADAPAPAARPASTP